MVFSSPTFLFVFLPLVLLATWAVPGRARRLVLLAASTVFYAWGVQELLLVVFASTLVDWALALGIARAREREDRRARTVLLVVAVAQNLALLGYFKYAGFATEQLNRFVEALGLGGTGILSVALPIGISFFTFEKISYVVDVARGDVQARRDPVDVLVFVSLFPRSIAGPIVRLREIQDDLRDPRPRPELAREGAIRFAHGLAKKVLIADQLAPLADASFAAAGDGGLTSAAAWLGLLAYSLQLYFDFSGYSDMAIGIALMLGFRLPENFRRPYSAVSMTDFWRRWHMTLTRWFRDYVYIPLGGNRGSARKTYRNLLVVFLLTGLWHGAAWTFVVWGVYHGAWLMLERRFGWRTVDGAPASTVWARRATTFLIVCLGWVLFRAGSLDQAADFYRAMFGFSRGMTPTVDLALDGETIAALIAGALIVLAPGARSGGRWLAEALGPRATGARIATLSFALPLALAYAFAGTFSPFLYFRF